MESTLWQELLVGCGPMYNIVTTWSLGEAFNGYCRINNTVVMWKNLMYCTRLACQIGWVL